MTVMSEDENFDISNVEEMICTAMESDYTIKEAHPVIQSIACIGSNEDRLQSDDLGDLERPTGTFEPVYNQIGPVSYVMSAIAAIFIVLGIYGYKRRHYKKEEKIEVGPLDDSDLANMSNSLSYEGTGPYNGTPAMDFTPINKPAFTAQGGIEAMARQSYFQVSQILMLAKMLCNLNFSVLRFAL